MDADSENMNSPDTLSEYSIRETVSINLSLYYQKWMLSIGLDKLQAGVAVTTKCRHDKEEE
jgi:hypothetical protein